VCAGSGAAGDGSEGSLGKIVIPAAQSDIVHMVRVPAAFGAGGGKLRLELGSKQAAGMGYQLSLRYHSRAQAAPAQAPLAIEVHYDRAQLSVNQTVAVEAIVKNRTGSAARMLLADIGTPPGFAVDPTGLEKLRADGKIDRYTLTARGVIVYINTIAAGDELRIKYAMIAKMPLKAVAAPTKVYAYYDPSQQAAVPAVTFTVK
jgi:hypothetical protein